MVTGATLATVNRLPVLLLPGDTFASRRPHPVLQQLEAPHDATVSVNDSFRPVSRFFDRVTRPEQLVDAALAAMRVLTDPAETGAVSLALPEDVQTEVVDVPDSFSGARLDRLAAATPTRRGRARRGAGRVRARHPLVVAGGGVIYSEATDALRALADATGIPLAETQAGRGALPSAHPSALGAVGATGTRAANALARDADLVIGVGTRWSDFTTASKSAFQDPDVRFVGLNVTALDAAKHTGLAVVSDARSRSTHCATRSPAPRRTSDRARRRGRRGWDADVRALVTAGHGPLPSQAEVIGAVNDAAGDATSSSARRGRCPATCTSSGAPDPAARATTSSTATRAWATSSRAGWAKLADPERPVFALVGDGSYLMLPGELATAVAERNPLVVVLVDNHGYASIGALSRSVGSAGFGTHLRREPDGGQTLDRADGAGAAGVAEELPIDLAANAESLGATVVRARTVADLRAALRDARGARTDRSSCTSRSTATPAFRATTAGGTCRSPRSRPTHGCARRAPTTNATGPPQRAAPGGAVSSLLVPPARPGADGTVAVVTPASAGWSHVGFEALVLAPGAPRGARHRRARVLRRGGRRARPPPVGARRLARPRRPRDAVRRRARRGLPPARHALRRRGRGRRRGRPVLRACDRRKHSAAAGMPSEAPISSPSTAATGIRRGSCTRS